MNSKSLIENYIFLWTNKDVKITSNFKMHLRNMLTKFLTHNVEMYV